MSEIVDAEIVHAEDCPALMAANLPAEVRAAAQQAVKYHRAADKALRSWAENVVFCGLELLEIKSRLNHGEWLPFLAENLPEISERHSRRYMQVAAAVQKKMGRKFAPSLADEAQLQKLATVIEKHTDATSWRQMFLDLGIGASAPVHGRGGAHAKELQERRDGTNQARAMAYTEELRDLVHQLRRAVLEDKHHAYLDPDTRQALGEGLLDVLKELRS
jgi:hypothetical protein